MGDVYAAFDETLKRRVALKAIRAEHRLSAGAKARFLREAHILSQLDHPHICRIYDFIEGADTDWLVLELIEGSSLHVSLRGGFNAARTQAIAEQIADVLVATHRAGVVHRDLKPGNVMLTHGDQVKVLDFGLAQSGEPPALPSGTPATASGAAAAPPSSLDIDRTLTAGMAEEQTRLGSIVGTLGYMSPEQARGEGATPASDVYAFGLIPRRCAPAARRIRRTLTT